MSNSDQAKACINIAKKAYAEGDTQKAIKFLQKSLNLEASSEAQVLLRAFTSKTASSSSNSAPPPPKAVPTASSSKEPPPSPKPFTPEQRAEALAILKKKDYYEVLGVERGATEKEIASAYRQLARRIHPDKNNAPEAEAAFKKITQANECLSDSNKRSIYDQTGHDEAQPQVAGPQFPFGRGGGYHFQHGGPMQPEDIFNLFFGQGAAHFQRRGYRRQAADDDDDRGAQRGHGGAGFGAQYTQLLQFLPLIILLLFSILANSNSISSSVWSSSNSPFSMEQSSAYPIRRFTQFNSPYFVSQAFERRYARDPSTLRSIESTVDSRYLQTLQEQCRAERTEQRKLDDLVAAAADYVVREDRERRATKHSQNAKWCDKVDAFLMDQHA